jgi:probable rRNA maturation factor
MLANCRYHTGMVFPCLAVEVFQCFNSSAFQSAQVIDNGASGFEQTLMGTLNKKLPMVWDMLSLQMLSSSHQTVLADSCFQKNREMELIWTDNAGIQLLNHQYRGKNKPTDVLTFNLLEDYPANAGIWQQLPVLPLGTVVISIEYAQQALAALTTDQQSFTLLQYLTERWIHGILHLHGFHHDTMASFEHVVGIQQHVLRSVFQNPALVSPLGMAEEDA